MIYYIFILISLLSLIFFIFYLKSKVLIEISLLTYLIGFGAFYELIFSFYFKINSEIWFKVYPFLEFIALLYFFKKLIGIAQSVFYFIVSSYIIIFLALYFLFLQTKITSPLELFIPITHCFLVFFGSTKWTLLQFEKLEASSLFQSPIFYILSGMILYYSGTFFIFGLESMFRNTKSSVLLYFWYVNLLLIFIYRLSFYIAIWKAKKL